MALSVASAGGHVEVIRILFNEGAEVNIDMEDKVGNKKHARTHTRSKEQILFTKFLSFLRQIES